MATNCIKTILFGEVCDQCDGGAILKIVAFCIKILSIGIITLATVGIIICGIQIMTARDNPAQVAKAKKRIIEIIIGLVVYALMFSIINFIIPGGVVTSTLGTETSSCADPEKPAADPPGGGQDGTGKDKDCYKDYGDNAKTALVYLMNKGYSPEAAAALVGIMNVESGGLRPNVIEGGTLITDTSWTVTGWDKTRTSGGAGFGLMQWTDKEEHDNLQAFADNMKMPVTSLEVQLKFLYADLACSKEAGCNRLDPNPMHKKNDAYAYFDVQSLNAYAARSVEEATFWLTRRYTIPSFVCAGGADGICERGGRTLVDTPRSYPAGAEAMKQNGGGNYLASGKKYVDQAKSLQSLANTSCKEGAGDGDDGDDGGDGDDDSDEDDGIKLSDAGLTGEKAKYFMSDPVVKCPKNTKHKDAGKTIDYTSGELSGYTVVNTPIDVIKYRDYLVSNHISMDGKTCTTDGSDCKGGSYYNDDGNCEKFAPMYAGNLYGNMCVSNDAFASHFGKTNTQMFFQSIWLEHGREPGSGQGNDVPSRVNKKYLDPRLHFDSAEKSAGIYPTWGKNSSDKCTMSKRILAEVVDHGNPVVIRVHNNGHSTVVVGVKTSTKNAYLNRSSDNCGSGGVPNLSGAEILYLNTDSKFWFNLNIGTAGPVTTHCGQATCPD